MIKEFFKALFVVVSIIAISVLLMIKFPNLTNTELADESNEQTQSSVKWHNGYINQKLSFIPLNAEIEYTTDIHRNDVQYLIIYQDQYYYINKKYISDSLTEAWDTAYINADKVDIKPNVSLSSQSIDSIPFNTEISYVSNFQYNGYTKVKYNDIIGYIYINPQKIVHEPIITQQEEVYEYIPEEYNWDGSVLSPILGICYGPSGKETYYNLDMSGVVDIMRSIGNTDPYWVRDDGAKMLGDYIMVAANLDIHPRGSIVQTSLGPGIVCDTGGFVYNGSGVSLDIATAW